MYCVEGWPPPTPPAFAIGSNLRTLKVRNLLDAQPKS
jgi:hypothetical protein